jgi:hypothetical protein
MVFTVVSRSCMVRLSMFKSFSLFVFLLAVFCSASDVYNINPRDNCLLNPENPRAKFVCIMYLLVYQKTSTYHTQRLLDPKDGIPLLNVNNSMRKPLEIIQTVPQYHFTRPEELHNE